MSLRSQIVLTMLLLAVAAGGWSWWPSGGKGGGPSERPGRRPSATLVLVEPARAAEDKIVVRAIGTGEARRSATIHAATGGEVTLIGFEAEQRVAKGKLLLRLDDKHQRLAVRLAKVAVKVAARQLRRVEKLAPSGAASMARLETAQTELESANLRLEQAKAELRDRSVYAPFGGIIGLTAIDVGDRITVDTPIATLDDRSYIKVAFTIPEEFTQWIAVGSLVTVRPRTKSGTEIAGAISATGSRIDPLTRSLQVEAEIPNTDDSLRPGTSFEVRLSRVGKTYPSVPEVSVLWSSDGAYLWRVEGDRAKKVFVKIVHRDGGRILVDGPLKVGDPIVVEGLQGLRPGQPVKTRTYAAEKPTVIKAPDARGRS